MKNKRNFVYQNQICPGETVVQMHEVVVGICVCANMRGQQKDYGPPGR